MAGLPGAGHLRHLLRPAGRVGILVPDAELAHRVLPEPQDADQAAHPHAQAYGYAEADGHRYARAAYSHADFDGNEYARAAH